MSKAFAKRLFSGVSVLAICSFLAACGGGGGMQGMSDDELAEKWDGCLGVEQKSPGKATACENLRKECERRRKEGHYVC